MKRWHVIFLMLVLVVAVFGCAEQTPEPAGTSIQEPASAPTELTTEIPTSPSGVHPIDLEGLECLVQVHTQAGSLSGSDRDPYTYYAIRESGVEQVDAEEVALIAPEMLDPVSSDYDNGETSRWFVELMYAPRVENYDSKGFSARNQPWLPTDFGENVRIYYSRWSHSDREMKAESGIEQVMLQTAYALFTEDLEKYSAGNEPAWQLTWFMVTANADTFFVEDRDNNLYRPMPDGSLQLLLEMPDNVTAVSRFWFPEK